MSDTGPAKLPGLPLLRTDDRALAAWAQAVTEHLEVRNGARGNAAEKVVVQRDLDGLNRRLDAAERSGAPAKDGSVSVDLGGGRTGSFPLDALVTALLGNVRVKEALSVVAPASVATPVAAPQVNSTAQLDALTSRVNDVATAVEEAADLAREAQSTAIASGVNKIFSRNQGLRHPGALAINPDVVLFNDVTVGEFMLDVYKRLYTAETKSKVSLDPGSIFYNGFTVEQWAQYVWSKLPA